MWDCDAAEHAMTASVRTAAAAAAAEPRQCTCRCLACASAGPHPNPRSNATCCFKSSELGGTGKPAAAFTATKSTTTAVRPADSTATAAVFIYPPSERDSLFFQRTLRAEAARLRRDAPTLCVEAFCGTAPLLGVLSEILPNCARLGLDLDSASCGAAAARPGVHGAARMDVARALRPGVADLIVALPPYVPTTAAALDAAGAAAAAGTSAARPEGAGWAWAGGPHGRSVLERLVHALPALLSARGAAYLLHFDAAWLLEEVAATGLAASVVAEETEVGERWCIVRVERPTPRAADG